MKKLFRNILIYLMIFSISLTCYADETEESEKTEVSNEIISTIENLKKDIDPYTQSLTVYQEYFDEDATVQKKANGDTSQIKNVTLKGKFPNYGYTASNIEQGVSYFQEASVLSQLVIPGQTNFISMLGELQLKEQSLKDLYNYVKDDGYVKLVKQGVTNPTIDSNTGATVTKNYQEGYTLRDLLEKKQTGYVPVLTTVEYQHSESSETYVAQWKVVHYGKKPWEETRTADFYTLNSSYQDLQLKSVVYDTNEIIEYSPYIKFYYSLFGNSVSEFFTTHMDSQLYTDCIGNLYIQDGGNYVTVIPLICNYYLMGKQNLLDTYIFNSLYNHNLTSVDSSKVSLSDLIDAYGKEGLIVGQSTETNQLTSLWGKSLANYYEDKYALMKTNVNINKLPSSLVNKKTLNYITINDDFVFKSSYFNLTKFENSLKLVLWDVGISEFNFFIPKGNSKSNIWYNDNLKITDIKTLTYLPCSDFDLTATTLRNYATSQYGLILTKLISTTFASRSDKTNLFVGLKYYKEYKSSMLFAKGLNDEYFSLQSYFKTGTGEIQKENNSETTTGKSESVSNIVDEEVNVINIIKAIYKQIAEPAEVKQKIKTSVYSELYSKIVGTTVDFNYFNFAKTYDAWKLVFNINYIYISVYLLLFGFKQLLSLFSDKTTIGNFIKDLILSIFKAFLPLISFYLILITSNSIVDNVLSDSTLLWSGILHENILTSEVVEITGHQNVEDYLSLYNNDLSHYNKVTIKFSETKDLTLNEINYNYLTKQMNLSETDNNSLYYDNIFYYFYDFLRKFALQNGVEFDTTTKNAKGTQYLNYLINDINTKLNSNIEDYFNLISLFIPKSQATGWLKTYYDDDDGLVSQDIILSKLNTQLINDIFNSSFLDSFTAETQIQMLSLKLAMTFNKEMNKAIKTEHKLYPILIDTSFFSLDMVYRTLLGYNTGSFVPTTVFDYNNTNNDLMYLIGNISGGLAQILVLINLILYTGFIFLRVFGMIIIYLLSLIRFSTNIFNKYTNLQYGFSLMVFITILFNTAPPILYGVFSTKNSLTSQLPFETSIYIYIVLLLFNIMIVTIFLLYVFFLFNMVKNPDFGGTIAKSLISDVKSDIKGKVQSLKNNIENSKTGRTISTIASKSSDIVQTAGKIKPANLRKVTGSKLSTAISEASVMTEKVKE